MGLKETIKQLWTKKIEKEYVKLLSQKKISYHAWVEKQEREEIAVSANASGNGGQYILMLQKTGRLAEHAKQWISAFFAEHPEVQILYGDEDFLTEQGIRENPWYKPCWSPDTYLSQFYVGSVIAVRNSLYEMACNGAKSESDFNGKVCNELKPSLDMAGKELRMSADGTLYFDKPEEIRSLLTACINLAGGFEKGCKTIAGCPHILFHMTDTQVWEEYMASAEKQFCAEELHCTEELSGAERQILFGAIDKKQIDLSDISVIIPSKDNPAVLGKCLESLGKIVGPEIIVVDNGSSEDNRKLIEELTRGMKYIYQPMEFNFSRMCNIGVNAASGKYLLFLNDDIEVCGEDWLYAMKARAALPYVGSVGLKLYYPDSRRIQHAGITNLPVGPVHKMQFTEDAGRIYFDRNRADMNCLAVTGACLLIEKGKYLEVGGLKESLRVAYNDVELGFALYEAGYQNVVINTQFAYHHESLSRGSDESREKQARLQKEREHLYEMHPALKDRDPYYPDLLHKDGPDVRIVPGYINALNTLQEAVLEEMCFEAEQIRVDNCLMPGIEVSEKSVIKGYSVVLGDNNACYDRYIVLAKEVPEEKQNRPADAAANLKSALMIKTEPQYRQDLEENIPDQENVALCGFHVHISESESRKLVKDARYIVGVLAVHKINKGKLLNWSSRYYINE